MRSTSRPSGLSMPTRISPCSAHLARCLASSSNPSHEWVTAARPRILPAGSTTQTSWDSLAQSMPTNITPPSDRGACPVTEARRGSLLTGARGASSHGRSALPGAGGGGGITLALEGRWTPALPPPVTEMLGASTPGEAVPWNPTQEGWTSNGRGDLPPGLYEGTGSQGRDRRGVLDPGPAGGLPSPYRRARMEPRRGVHGRRRVRTHRGPTDAEGHAPSSGRRRHHRGGRPQDRPPRPLHGGPRGHQGGAPPRRGSAGLGDREHRGDGLWKARGGHPRAHGRVLLGQPGR